jgi:adenine-specific DNA-methyltransferase
VKLIYYTCLTPKKTLLQEALIFYAKDKLNLKYRNIFKFKKTEGDSHWNYIQLQNNKRVKIESSVVNNHKLIPEAAKLFQLSNLYPARINPSGLFDIEFHGKTFTPPKGNSWKTNSKGMKNLILADRIMPYASGDTIRYVLPLDDYPITPHDNFWDELAAPSDKTYVVQTTRDAISRCLLMTTDPGDLVLDPTCGSGTTAFVAEQWGRRWITCDTSRVAIALAKQRLMTATYDYYELAKPAEGVGSGFNYETVPHITLKSIAHNEQIDAIHEKWKTKLDEIRSNLNKALNKKWEEWEIPFDPDPDWTQATKKLHDEWMENRRKRQQEIDESIQKNAPREILYDKPNIDSKKARVTGPFTVEAVPAATVKSIQDLDNDSFEEANTSIARTGESLRQAEWRDELFKTGFIPTPMA